MFCSECDAFGMVSRPPARVGVTGWRCTCGRQTCRTYVGSVRLDPTGVCLGKVRREKSKWQKLALQRECL